MGKSEDLGMQVRERALLYEIQRSFSGVIDLDELLPIVIARTKSAFEVESSAVLLVDPRTSELYFPHVSDVDPEVERRFASIRVPPGRGIAGWVVEHGETQCVADVRKDPRWYGHVDEESGMRSESLLCTPLHGKSSIVGVIELRNKLAGQFTPGDIRLIEALAGAIGRALENALRYARTQESEERLKGELAQLNRQAARDSSFRRIVGQSESMRKVFRLMESAVTTPITVVIHGESGTGKELVAKAIHYGGDRADHAFVAVNCGGLSDTLLESELFGHKKGAFTGADNDRLGVFEVADKGTIFLDEVGDMPTAMQIKLLRVLQEGEVVRVGETIPRKVDVRVIAASHVDLSTAVQAGVFREDLYYRLNAFPIQLPPLRERKDDLRLIAVSLLERTIEKFGKGPSSFAPEVLAVFDAHDWPGNVRELQNEIERAATMAAARDRIELEDLSDKFQSMNAPKMSSALSTGNLTLKEARDLFEREYVAQVLAQHRGNAAQACKTLGISRVMLQKKIRQYDLRRTPQGQAQKDGRSPRRPAPEDAS
jgi:Nif-specific regulatory protein